MTTPETPENRPQEFSSAYPQESSAPTASGSTATLPPPYSPLEKKRIGLALAALLVGIGAFLVGLIPVLGALVGVCAIVLGVLALRKQQSKGMALTGLILGCVALLASIGTTIGLGAAVNSASENSPIPVISESETPDPEEPTVPDPEPVVVPEPPAETPQEPIAPEVPVEFASALTKAASYSDLLSMSKAGIYDQLTSEFGEQFSPEAAQYAVDNLQADYNANALEKAKMYQDTMAMSPAAIRDQLVSEFGEKFTAAEADYAIANLNG